ncbi:MAG: ABC transporter ATP-binding protein [Clostridia bacterium]|nr:ABC transporter ATP-binding protein [Clostridia bacterium]
MADLELVGIRKKFKRKEVLRGVDLSVDAGSCVGILGGNGSGKSTLLTILAGIRKADAGKFLWLGKDLLRDEAARRAAVGYVPQGTPLFEELSARDNLRLWYDKAQLERELESGILKMLGVDEFLNVRVSRLSGGMKKRLSIGCAMNRHPDLMLLDEPSSALDLPCKAEIQRYFRAFKEAGGTILLVTHDLQEMELCDRLFVLRDGVLHPFEGDLSVTALAEAVR